MDRQLQGREQPRPIVVEEQLAVVKVGDRFGQSEAEAGAFVRAARIEAAEAAAGLVAALERNAGTAVGDLDPDLLFPWVDSNVDLSAARGVADGMLSIARSGPLRWDRSGRL